MYFAFHLHYESVSLHEELAVREDKKGGLHQHWRGIHQHWHGSWSPSTLARSPSATDHLHWCVKLYCVTCYRDCRLPFQILECHHYFLLALVLATAFILWSHGILNFLGGFLFSRLYCRVLQFWISCFKIKFFSYFLKLNEIRFGRRIWLVGCPIVEMSVGCIVVKMNLKPPWSLLWNAA